MPFSVAHFPASQKGGRKLYIKLCLIWSFYKITIKTLCISQFLYQTSPSVIWNISNFLALSNHIFTLPDAWNRWINFCRIGRLPKTPEVTPLWFRCSLWPRGLGGPRGGVGEWGCDKIAAIKKALTLQKLFSKKNVKILPRLLSNKTILTARSVLPLDPTTIAAQHSSRACTSQKPSSLVGSSKIGNFQLPLRLPRSPSHHNAMRHGCIARSAHIVFVFALHMQVIQASSAASVITATFQKFIQAADRKSVV